MAAAYGLRTQGSKIRPYEAVNGRSVAEEVDVDTGEQDATSPTQTGGGDSVITVVVAFVRQPADRGRQVGGRRASPARPRCWPRPPTPGPTPATRSSCSSPSALRPAARHAAPAGLRPGGVRLVDVRRLRAVHRRCGRSRSWHGIQRAAHPEPATDYVIAYVVLAHRLRARGDLVHPGVPAGRAAARTAGAATSRVRAGTPRTRRCARCSSRTRPP